MLPVSVAEFALAVTWLTAFVGLGALSAPVSSLVFSRRDGRGVGLTIPLALAVVGIVGFWIGRLSFGRLSIGLGLAVLVGASWYALSRGVAVDWHRYAEVVAVFTVSFVFLLGVRAVDPSVVAIGGEKYLDYGLLHALSRAEALPPEDPWFAGERVRYYYGGHLVAASLGRLTATQPYDAYNLALAGTYATTVSTVYGLAGSIAADGGIDRVRAGLLAAFFVGVASNLATPVRVLAWLVPGGHAIANALEIPLTRGGTETVAFGLESFSYWDASRVIPGTINEFPLFAFLNGDLHAHMLSIPFLCLAIGLCYEYWLTPEGDRRRRRLLAFVLVPIVVGWLAVANTWDVPTALGLTWLTLALAPSAPWTLLPDGSRLEAVAERTQASTEVARPLVAACVVAVVGLAGALVVFPYVIGVSSAGGRSMSIALVTDRSGLVPFLLVHGAFLFVAWWSLSTRLDVDPSAIRRETVALATVGVVLVWILEGLAVLLAASLVVVGWYAIRTDRGGFETLLFVAGAGLVATVEVVYLSEPAGAGRLNTVFKTYAHVWVVWSLAAGVALASLCERSEALVETRLWGRGGDRARPNAGVSRSRGRAGDGRRPSGRTVVVAVVLCALSLYGVLALTAHADSNDRDRFGLDAREELRETEPGVAAAIDWLADREGRPRIVEAPTPPEHTYGSSDGDGRPPPSRAVSGASTFSGLPTLAGWTHAADYHGEDAYWERVDTARTVFEGTDAERAAVLDRYDIRYVYVGPNERAWYAPDLEGDPALEVAATFDGVTIYAVDESALET